MGARQTIAAMVAMDSISYNLKTKIEDVVVVYDLKKLSSVEKHTDFQRTYRVPLWKLISVATSIFVLQQHQ